jgi:hypothetical protein
MKLPKKNHAGGTESLGEYCVRSFSGDSERNEPGFIGLFSGVPVLGNGGKKQDKKSAGGDGVHGKVIT